ncbi:Methylmalonyl-CoA mutase [Anoxybacillus thermarum]|uniref:Methylmalonyl-CoA mutase n=1 Tax=Anoxybacillus thermarum TaxID=404937 RepID=A0A0D0RVL6_9BACL
MKQISFPIPSYDEWKQEVEKSLKGKPFDRLYTKTYEQIQLKPIYTRADLEGLPIEQYPGFPSYVRGTEVEGYIKKAWEVSQQCAASTPERWNELMKHQLERGQTEIHVVLPKLKFVVQTIEQIETMFSNISLENYSLRIDTGACAFPFLPLFVAYIEESGQPLSRMRGTIGMDPLHSLTITGQLPMSLSTLYDVMADVTTWAKTNMPHVKTILVHADPYHNGGGNAIV